MTSTTHTQSLAAGRNAQQKPLPPLVYMDAHFRKRFSDGLTVNLTTESLPDGNLRYNLQLEGKGPLFSKEEFADRLGLPYNGLMSCPREFKEKWHVSGNEMHARFPGTMKLGELREKIEERLKTPVKLVMNEQTKDYTVSITSHTAPEITGIFPEAGFVSRRMIIRLNAAQMQTIFNGAKNPAPAR